MLFAFLTQSQWFILAGILLVVAVLLLFPTTRPLVTAITRSVRALLSCLLWTAILVVSAVPIFTDLEYLLLGHEAEATVTSVQPGKNGVRVAFQFTDGDGTPRTGKDTASVGWAEPPGGTVTVQYLPGEEGSARLSRLIVHWLPYVLFFGSGVMLLLTIALAVRRLRMGA